MGFLTWLEGTGIGVWVRESLWGYPIVISTHAVGMAIVVGTAMMLSLRLVGFANQIPISSFRSLYTVVVIGAVLNVLSGLFLFAADASTFFFNTPMQFKAAFLVLGVTAIWQLLKATSGGEEPDKVKMIAAFSLVCWFGTIIAGRLSAYLS